MADQTQIEWTDATWNIITGCSVVSPGCTNCYAMKLAGTRLQHHPSRAGLTTASKAGPVWNGQVRFNAEWLTQPLRWTKPRMIFVCAHGDLFHEGVPDDWLDQIFAVMALCDQHTFQVLTKRPERMLAYLADPGRRRAAMDAVEAVKPLRLYGQRSVCLADQRRTREKWEAARESLSGCFLPNVWLGVSVEDQARADERIPILLDTAAAVRWISAEPLLGPIDLTDVAIDLPECRQRNRTINALEAGEAAATRALNSPDWSPDGPQPFPAPTALDWVVAGGESGPGARPLHPDWARQLRDQCAEAGVPFLFKQWGDWMPVTVEGDPEWDTIDEGIDPARAQALSPRETCLLYSDGRRQEDKGLAFQTADPRQMLRLGKKAAGRRLDGQLHDGFPTTAEARA